MDPSRLESLPPRARRRYIVQAVANACSVPMDLIYTNIGKKPLRKKPVSEARAICCVYLYETPHASWPIVAHHLGLQYHDSALRAARRGRVLLQENPDIRAEIDEALGITFTE